MPTGSFAASPAAPPAASAVHPLVRALGAADAPAFLALRLSALQESPSAFGSSYDEEKTLVLPQVQARLAGFDERVFFGGFADDALVAMVGVGREPNAKQRHIGFVRGLYVAPAARRQGLGRHLLLAALHHAVSWDGVEQLTLTVTAGNQPALGLYHSLGLVEVGHRPRALRIGTDYFDEIDMVLSIAGGGDACA